MEDRGVWRGVIVTHAVREESLRATVGGLEKLDAVNRIASVIRVEDPEAEEEYGG